MRNSGSGANRLFSQLAAEKKKAIIVSCLIGVMVFMWARVLGRKTAQTAKAAITTQETGQSNSESKISFIKLPKVEGRNDVLSRDFFAADGRQGFTRDGEGIPTETTAELVTNIMLKDGQTILIGGLFRDDVRTIRSQIPLLGDLPIVGAAFRSTTDNNVRQEIIVLLTPHIITEPEQTDGQARADDMGRKRYGARMALQWIGRARLAEGHYTEAVKDYIEGDDEAALLKVNWALELRPTYLEALRLKERIIGETLQKGNAESYLKQDTR